MRRVLALWILLACGSPEPAWQVRPDGVGRIRFGMSVGDAAKALDTPAGDSIPRDGCAFWRPTGAPPGLSLMIENGQVVRADIDSAGVQTREGVGVGSTETAVAEAYPNQITQQPHKYRWEEGWRYLVLKADSQHALVFESDGAAIHSYRGGLEPQVEYVERCG